jgi:hypothetical protein
LGFLLRVVTDLSRFFVADWVLSMITPSVTPVTAVTEPPRGLNLSPRTVDAQVPLRSGHDKRGNFIPRQLGQREPKNDGGAGQQSADIFCIWRSFSLDDKFWVIAVIRR